jgi:hypothetical protein
MGSHCSLHSGIPRANGDKYTDDYMKIPKFINYPNMDVGRLLFVVAAWVLGAFLVVVALATAFFAGSVGFTAWKSKDATAIKEYVQACAALLTIMGVAISGVLYLVRLVFQRELDAAVELTVEVEPIEGNQNKVALVAKLKNVTNVAAGIKSLEYCFKNAATDNPVENCKCPKWELPKPATILTRNSTWRLVKVVDMPAGGPLKLVARCGIELQPEEQAIYFETMIPMREFPPEAALKEAALKEAAKEKEVALKEAAKEREAALKEAAKEKEVALKEAAKEKEAAP